MAPTEKQKPKKEQKAQEQPQKPPEQQQQPQQEKQKQKQKPYKQQPGPGQSPASQSGGAVSRDLSVVSAKSSSSGDGTLANIDENLDRMRIDKEKLRRTDLRAVLCRSGAHGTRGKAVTVEANFFRLLIDKIIGTAYHYDVAIEPDTPKKFLRDVFAQFCAANYPNQRFAYDGQKIAYAAKKLPDAKGKLTFQPKDGGKSKEFTVQVKMATTVDLSSLKSYMTSNVGNLAKPMSAIQCLDVVLRTAYENNPNFVRFKRCVYAVPRDRIDLTSGHELWYGLFQSALLGSRPYLNVDISHKAFPSGGPLVPIIASFNKGNVDRLENWVLNDINSYLKGMDVMYKSPGGVARRMRCHGMREPASQQRFKMEDGTQLTVADYFRQKLKYTLRYPNLPVLHVGSSVRNVYVPPELCEVPFGQALNKQHPEACTAAIIKFAATSTDVRKQKIMNLVRSINYGQCPTYLDFGIGVGNDFEKVPARIIDPPNIEYASKKVVRPMRGTWRAEGMPFIQPSTTISKQPLRWRILNLDQQTNESQIEAFGNMLFRQAKSCNVQMEPFSMRDTFVLVRNVRDCMRDLGNILANIKKDNPTITIVVLPFRGETYSKVKQKAELASERIGLLTQCIKAFTIQRKGTDMSTINNIMLKINAKTNGSNHCLTDQTVPPAFRGKVMYIGADVTHPFSDDVPSVVGVSAVYDLVGFRYNCSIRLQGARDEMIRDLENIVHRQLLLYRDYNGDFPERIMYYRDGVSDGQFAEVLTIELQALHAAIARAKPGYKPAVSFIVVQKRHHTRFFPQAGCPAEGKNNNVPPGTIVDREITAPDRFEFYLVSHAAVQGVAKPTKYVVLYDDSNCNPDQLQALTYNLCHMFARCNRAVSYPAPTYYAHLAAYRGRVYIKE
ncbi:AGAP011537-PA-like protein [Anopheles sinensis]|uniref:AGAP011537-PA-like protein n=1 Tax=Anopheles sinensis TaxID=74873 RepID=A0A084VRL4_ANOSI|nr:AGAP011537-PA-like protein [Anopheles sinensis]